MKKNVWAKMLSLVLVLTCVIGLAACGKDGGSSAAGTYNFQTIDMGGITMDMEQLADTLGEAADQIKMALVLKEDGSSSLDAAAVDENMSMEGTWEEKGGNIELTSEGSTISCTLKDGVLTISEEGIVMTFKK